jgi:ribose transport system substrate-binding protein
MAATVAQQPAVEQAVNAVRGKQVRQVVDVPVTVVTKENVAGFRR